LYTVPPATGLPSRFSWYPIRSEQLNGGVQLRLDGVHIIAVVGVSAGRWHCTVNMHRGVDRVRWSYCGSRAQGMRWAELWLKPRADRVTAGIESPQGPQPAQPPAMGRDDKRTERERRG